MSTITSAWMAAVASICKVNFATTTWGEKESNQVVKAALDATGLTEQEKADVMVAVGKVINPSAFRQYLYKNNLLAKPAEGAKRGGGVDWAAEIAKL